jgi:hypothetical protein
LAIAYFFVTEIVEARAIDMTLSGLVSAPPNEKDERNDQENSNQHPNLPIESEKAKFSNQQLHRSRPFIVQAESFSP